MTFYVPLPPSAYIPRHGMETALLGEFIKHTGADPTLARDILEGQQWDMKSALQVFYFLTEHNLYQKPTEKQTTVAEEPPPNLPPPLVPIVTVAIPPVENGTLKEEEETEGANKGASVQRSQLQKSEAVDLEYKKLARGISRATDNVNLVSRARSKLAQDLTDSEVCHISQYFIDTPIYTFTLPDITVYPEDFRAFLERDLIEISILVSLEQAGRLNWWAGTGACQRLWPLATTGDGNCLLHAASLGMWGFHDRLLTLRRALHAFMTQSKHTDALYRRWRWQQTLQNAQAGFQYSEDEWRQEWDIILKMASTEPRTRPGRRRSSVYDNLLGGCSTEKGTVEGATYESLEEIHVMALCHVLQRPIIIIADTILKDVNGEALAPIPFGGIYLPLECSPSECHQSPLVLAFDAAHFSALVVMEKEGLCDRTSQPAAVIPLTDAEHQLLPIQFSVDPGENFAWGRDETDPQVVQKLTLLERDRVGVLKEYMEVLQVPFTVTDDSWDHDNSDSSDFSPTHGTAVTNGDTRTSDEAFFFDGGKNKPKQLQSVAKQFGSIGRSMSKKLKKNFGSIINRSNSFRKKEASNSRRTLAHVVSRSQDYIVAARIHTDKRHEFHAEMVRNYLQTARIRFEKEQAVKVEAEIKKVKETAAPSSVTCVNQGCTMFGTAATSYMCSTCFAKQKEQERTRSINSPPTTKRNEALYGTGKSKFYAESDSSNLTKVPVSKANSNNDQTLYLSKSTFYNDGTSTVPTSYNLAKEEKKSAPSRNKTPTDVLKSTTSRIDDLQLDQRCRNTTIATLVPRCNNELPGVSVNEVVKVTTPPEKRKTNSAGLNMPCRNTQCQFFGSPETAYYCSKCYRENGAVHVNVVVQQARTSQV